MPRGPLASHGPREMDTFLEEHGLPSLLWRILSGAGYTAGMEPHYYWICDDLVNHGHATVKVVVPPLPGDADWVGWRHSDWGVTAWDAANGAAYNVLAQLMTDIPERLAQAFPGVFPQADPCHSKWLQADGMALVGGAEEAESSSTPAMSTLFAVMKAYHCLHTYMLHCDSQQREMRRQAHRERQDFEAEVERLNEELARMTAEKDKAVDEKKETAQLARQLRSRLDKMTTSLHNCEALLGRTVQEKEAAQDKLRSLKDRHDKMEQELDRAEEYINTLREEHYRLHYGQGEFLMPDNSASSVSGNEGYDNDDE